MAGAEEPVPDFIEQTITFQDGQSFEILKPLTNYRSCHDGTPKEARMVFTCRRISPDASTEEYVMKVKTQLPAEGQVPIVHPSTTTEHELKALTTFHNVKSSFAPQLVGFHCQAQDGRGPLPGGFQTFTVMTKMPGYALFGKYWNMSTQDRDEIIPKAAEALRSIYALGIEPVDRGMRNVIWDPDMKQCSIIDFELWNETQEIFADDKTELQRWGLIRTPPAKDHWAAWNSMYR
ncbi:hypothetical protein LTS08_008375 [Lithohypha guttulata]|uniref:Uncharacterized protein n=1 Tax=Lithohypha guttulata TaxID=1690604 RepID=A0AAN7T3S9_9EURO|nr:hypothetical protein LTR05_002067 [Lithohypha guttulata]KAK5094979.1 hypothetical protein LTS08_008375 [Lithohypha guttulata]